MDKVTTNNTHREVFPSVKGISLAFKGVKAITNISFDIYKGEICAIIGPNGAGKSSMLNVINGVYYAQEGTVTFDGRRGGACACARLRWKALLALSRTLPCSKV